MSDNESNDGLDELQDLIDEYAAKPNNKIETPKEVKENKKTKSSKKKKQKNEETKETENVMDKILFGDKESFIEALAEAVDEGKTETNDTNKSDANKIQTTRKRKPAWQDADDDEIRVGEVKRTNTNADDDFNLEKYKDFIVKRYNRIVPQPKWASLENKPQSDAEEDSDSDAELIKTVGFISKNHPQTCLRQHLLDFKRLKDLNRATYAEKKIVNIEFHPTSSAALVTSQNGLATIYSIDGYKNEKLHSMNFQHFPIKCAKITPCGTKAIFGSHRNFYYSYDLLTAQETRYYVHYQKFKGMQHFEISPCGRYIISACDDGHLHLIDAKSQELIHTFRQEYKVTRMRFTNDSKRIIFTTKSVNVYVYSIRERRIEHIFIDDGCINGNALDLSPNQRMLATGTREGIVNVYDLEKTLLETTPKPEKVFYNLTTFISDLKFNHTSELLAMCSNHVPNAVKIAHFPSATVMSNFPGNATVGNVNTIAMSPNSGYLALGNIFKTVPLFRLKHFKRY